MTKPIKHIKAWQIHIIEDRQEIMAKVKEQRPDIKLDKAIVLTGTIVDDPTGKFNVGDHTRTSIVIDKTDNTFETGNTIYKVLGPQGDTTIGGGDWGANVMKIYY